MVVYNGNLIYVDANQLKQMPKDGNAPPVSIGTGFGNCQRLYAILIPKGNTLKGNVNAFKHLNTFKRMMLKITFLPL